MRSRSRASVLLKGWRFTRNANGNKRNMNQGNVTDFSRWLVQPSLQAVTRMACLGARGAVEEGEKD